MSKSGAVGRAEGESWPPWARRSVSALLVVHIVAVVSAELGVPPMSIAESRLSEALLPYTSLLGLDHAHRYYAPEPSPTPVATARLRFADGRPERIVRLPDPATRPRLRYQRELALAYHLASEFELGPPPDGPGGEPRRFWARSYARHLCKTTPGCAGVTLSVRMHRFPAPERLHESVTRPDAAPLDLDAEEFFTTPERIGDFSCDGF